MKRVSLLNAKSLLASAVLLTALYLLIIISEAARNELVLFIESSADVVPFVFLAMLAYLGEKDRRVRPFAVLWCLLLVTAIALFSFGLGALSLSDASGIENVPLEEIMRIAVLCLLAALFSLLGFLPGFRIICARHLPLNPRSFVHTLALVMVIAITLLPVVPLMATGTPPLLTPSVLQSLDLMQMGTAETLKLFTYSLFWTIFGSFMMVGLFLKRDLQQALKRLALVLPTAIQVLTAMILALTMVAAFFIIDEGIRAFWEMMGWQTTDPERVMTLFESALTPLGALALSISAGVGEELAVRGVLQPRFGLIWPSLLFASLHAYQYGWDALLSVFLAGMVFAFLRKYTNTSTCAIAHTTYDLVLFMMVMTGIS
jgi:membrane protease YdiL (CAAX protease family)